MNLNQMPKLTSHELHVMAVFWLLFIIGMSVVLGPGGIFLGISIPALFSICCDRLNVAIYNGKED